MTQKKIQSDQLDNIAVSNLNSGTGATSSTFWRGDGTWATPATGAGGSTTQVQYNNAGSLAGSVNMTFDSAAGKLTLGGTLPNLTSLNSLLISSPNSSTTANNISITAGANSVSSATASDISITGGSGTHATTSTRGGNISITGGAVTSTGSGNGGDVLVTGGTSSATTTGRGGNVTLVAGNGKAAGDVILSANSGGNIYLISRDTQTIIAPTGAWQIGGAGTNYMGSNGSVFMSQGVNTPTMWSLPIIDTNSWSLITPKASGSGIKVDYASPTWCWKDLIGQIVTRGGVTLDPTFNTFITNIRAYQFTVNDEVFITYHLPHDYVVGTEIYFHVHWAHNNASITSGGVTWTYTATYAKGFNQGAFPATVTGTITQTASTVQYQHMVAEGQLSIASGSASQLNSTNFEPDGLILLRLQLTSNTMNGGPEPFVFQADCHYQSTNVGTKQKAPNFYV